MRAIRAVSAFDGEQFLPGATVVVDGDQIVGVEAYAAELPAEVEVTEYSGTVLPGLVDAHTHLVADATIGGLERAGSMSDDALDESVAEQYRTEGVRLEIANA